MNTVEMLFKNAQDVLDDEIFVPVVLKKLAERGYTPDSEEEVVELLKHACVVRDAARNGEIALVPQSALDEDGNLSKQASDALSEDPFAYAEEFTVELEKLGVEVQDAAAVGLCGFKMATAEMAKESSASKAIRAARKGAKAVAKGAKKGAKKAKGAAKGGKKPANAKKTPPKEEPGYADKARKYIKKNPLASVGAAAGVGAATGAGGGYVAGKKSKKD